MNQIINMESIDQDIEQMLEVALVESKKSGARNTFAYALGREETLSDFFKARYEQAFDEALPVSEVFRQIIGEKLPDIAIFQSRIGVDTSSGMPIALFILSDKSAGARRAIQMIARDVEVEAATTIGFSGMIWTMVKSDSLDIESVSHDFPYLRIE